MEFHENPANQGKKFTPLRMTIMGQAGTGKSHLINTITSVVRTIFGEDDSVHITGPTGKISYTTLNFCIIQTFSYHEC